MYGASELFGAKPLTKWNIKSERQVGHYNIKWYIIQYILQNFAFV